MNNNDTFSCCFTGYRPQKLPFPIGANREYNDFELDLYNAILTLAKEGCRVFYSGMAMGFDIIAAECALLVAHSPAFKDVGIEVVCAIPFKEQAKKYPADWKARYEKVLAEADKAILISNDYYRECYFDRNRFMVDNSDCVLTWFDGNRGGTKNTIEYAKSIGRKVININAGYENG